MDAGLFHLNYTVIESAIIENGSMKIDILPYIVSYEFTESIFQQSMYGAMIINDANNLLNKEVFRFNGEERVTINIRNVEGIDFVYTWILADVELEVKNTMADSAMVVITLVSRDFFRNSYMFKSKGYVNMPRKNIIQKILEEELKSETPHNSLFFEFDPNKEKGTTFGFTKIRPFEKIEIIRQQMHDDDSQQASTYLFFEDRRGYSLISFENMLTKALPRIPQEYIYSQNMAGNKYSNPLFRGIKSFEPGMKNSNFNKIINGLYSSEVYRFDFTTKRLTIQNYDITKDKAKFGMVDVDNDSLLNMTADFRREIEENGRYTYFIPYDSSNSKNDMTYKHFQYSKPFLYLLEENTLNIFVDGNMTLNLGDPLDVKIWKNMSRNVTDENLDDRYSGRYIIQTLTNTIYRGADAGSFVHDTSISLTRDSNPNSAEMSKRIQDINNQNSARGGIATA